MFFIIIIIITSFGVVFWNGYFVVDRSKYWLDIGVEQQTADEATAAVSTSRVFAEMVLLSRKTKALEKHIHL